MVELTEKQSSVGEVLGVGSRLVKRPGLGEEEAEQLKRQMRLLNTRWEALRTQAMERQTL